MTDEKPTDSDRVYAARRTLPDWVPSAAQVYLAHTEAGLSIRALARAAGCHASTILRQIRRIETRRDDPLVDAALKKLSTVHFRRSAIASSPYAKDDTEMNLKEQSTPNEIALSPNDPQFRADAARVLRRMCENGAVLAVAANMEKAVIVRDTAGGVATRTGVVDRAVAEAMALKEWISARQSGKITRYSITPAGRTALEDLLERAASATNSGFAENPAQFDGAQTNSTVRFAGYDDEEASRRLRYSFADSPLTALARRKDKDGNPFLDNELVSAGEHLREDFELAQMGPRVTQNWDRFLSAGGREGFVPDSGVPDGPSNARKRVADALADLGPGLSDIVLRCCCHLEGLETAEKKLGWSARSGKIVLRIALIRLKRHYDETVGPGGPLIG